MNTIFNARSVSRFGLIILLSVLAALTFSQEGLWKESLRYAPIDHHSNERLSMLRSFKIFRPNYASLIKLLHSAPTDLNSPNTPIISLPMPDGSFKHFQVWESALLSIELQAQRPDIKTYTAKGVEDPSAIGHFDISNLGFQAMISTPKGDVYLDLYDWTYSKDVLCYYSKDSIHHPEDYYCGTDESMRIGAPNQTRFVNPSGTNARTYRLAINTTGEFTNYWGSVASAQAKVVTYANRVALIYERDISVKLNLIRNNPYPDPATDPFSNPGLNDSSLSENQTDLNSNLTSAGYDVGFLLVAGSGGVAYVGVICNDFYKGQGAAGGSGYGDDYHVGVICHEMGHMFGANHTFNSDYSVCLSNINNPTAFEPGCGSTIMAYPGLCGPDNITGLYGPNLYFHTVSYAEMIQYRDSGATCQPNVATGNTPPTVNAGLNYTIPQSTPFVLTGSATDPNADALTYCWEEYDLGLHGVPTNLTDNSTRPLFRSFPPNSSPYRSFPQITDLLNNTTTIGEFLPNVNRSMHFRLTVRDNRVGGGGVDYGNAFVTVAGTPFKITSPAAGTIWPTGSQQTITWTPESPQIAANVRILISTDGGNSFSVLVASTPNNGSKVITVPSTITSNSRIRIEAIGNIFFDMSRANFSIVQGNITYTGSVILNGWTGAVLPKTNVTVDGVTTLITLNPVTTNKGTFTVSLPPNSTHTIKVKPQGFLARKLIVTTVASNQSGLFGAGSGLLSGDINDNNLIDDTDILGVINNFLQGPPAGLYEANGDGIFDDTDLLAAINHFLMVGDN